MSPYEWKAQARADRWAALGWIIAGFAVACLITQCLMKCAQ